MAERAFVQLVHVDPADRVRTLIHYGWATITDKGYVFEQRPAPLEHPADQYQYERLPTSGPHAFRVTQ